MNKLYNKQSDLTSKLVEVLSKIFPNMRKTQLNFLPSLIFGIIMSQSVVAADITNHLKEEKKWAQTDSIIKRIYRLWNNKLFDSRFLLNKVVIYILKNFYTKHSKTIHIAFDHMYSHENYIVYMFTMRIGTQGIPIWYKCFNGTNSDAFKIKTLKEGVKCVSTLFGVDNYELVFLADRWFSSTELLDYIDSLGHIYRVRLKGNISVYKKRNGKEEKIKSKKLNHKESRAVVHKDVRITDKRYKTNIVYAKTQGTKDPWIIVTNKKLETAVADYSYRFGAIECMFKNQKSNGFNLEKISNMNIDAFSNMYGVLCICVILMMTIGVDYAKNPGLYKKIKITTHKTYIIDGKKIKKRIMSIFNAGLTIFTSAVNSFCDVRLPLTFKLHDV